VIKSSGSFVVDDDARGFGELEVVYRNFLEDDGAETSLVLAPKLVFVEYVIKFFYKAFDLPCEADLESLVFSCFNNVDNVEFLGSVITRLFVNYKDISDQMSFRSKSMSYWQFH
jgi:hypothetical protein